MRRMVTKERSQASAWVPKSPAGGTGVAGAMRPESFGQAFAQDGVACHPRLGHPGKRLGRRDELGSVMGESP